MKKIAMLISFLLLLSMTSVCFGNENYEQEIYDVINENSSQYGGYYYNGNTLHIIPCQNADNPILDNDIKTAAENGKINIVYDKPVIYSYKELDDGYYKLIEIWDELQLKELAVDVETNSITAGAVKWTDESKEKAEEYSGIENIDFYVSEGVIEGTGEDKETVNDLNFLKNREIKRIFITVIQGLFISLK